MFYFKITVRRKRGDTRSSTNEFREAIHVEDIGSIVATHLKGRSVKAVTVNRISQAAYMRATRGE